MLTLLLLLIGLHCWWGLKKTPSNSTLSCGLFGGASSTLTATEVDRIIQLGIISQLRGTDSTGIMSCYREGGKVRLDLRKSVQHSTDFFMDREVNHFLDQKKPFLIAGHCRAATIGDINEENAHPYSLGKIIGMKNGTVNNLRGKQADETDSKALLRILQDEGLEAAAFEAQNGGYALVWIDSRDHTLNFFRNKGRPFYIMEGHSTIYWASEYAMLVFMRTRAGLDLKSNPVTMLPEEVHFRYPLHNIVKGLTETKINVKKKSFIHTTTYRPVDDTKKAGMSDITKKVPTTVLGPTVPIVPKQAPLDKKYGIKGGTGYEIKAFRGRTLQPGKARRILADGCAGCNTIFTLDRVEETNFFNKSSFLCNKCADDAYICNYVGAKEMHRCKLNIGDCHGNC